MNKFLADLLTAADLCLLRSLGISSGVLRSLNKAQLRFLQNLLITATQKVCKEINRR